MKTLMQGTVVVLSLAGAAASFNAYAGECDGLPTYSELKQALASATTTPPLGTIRFGLNMWGTVVNRDGIVCAVAFTGADRGAQWPGSRVISAQKANTANSFSLDGLALSTAQLFPLVQPGHFLFGLQESNPVDTSAAYKGPSSNFGLHNDPLVGSKIGGVNVFGGGLALYSAGKVIGAVGVSGDTSCADHNIAWQTRKLLGLNITPTSDNISYAAGNHPTCLGGETPPAP